MTSTLFILQNQPRDEANGGNNLRLDPLEYFELTVLYVEVYFRQTT